jgi:hypothetical protein
MDTPPFRVVETVFNITPALLFLEQQVRNESFQSPHIHAIGDVDWKWTMGETVSVYIAVDADAIESGVECKDPVADDVQRRALVIAEKLQRRSGTPGGPNSIPRSDPDLKS